MLTTRSLRASRAILVVGAALSLRGCQCRPDDGPPPHYDGTPSAGPLPVPGAGVSEEHRGLHDNDVGWVHDLVDGRQKIERRVEETPDGIISVTESSDPVLAAVLKKHVASMKARVEEGQPFRRRDPLQEAIFARADEIEMRVEETERGVRVIARSDDPEVAELIRAEAQVIDRLLSEGWSEVRQPHPVPAGASDGRANR